MKTELKTAESIFRQITIDLSAYMGYKHKQYDDITLVVVEYNAMSKSPQTLLDLQDRIDYSNITEWNW